jgi:hypothetical protein
MHGRVDWEVILNLIFYQQIGGFIMIERWTPKIKQEQCTEGMTLRMWTDKEGDYVLYSDYLKEINNLKDQILNMQDSSGEPDADPEFIQER